MTSFVDDIRQLVAKKIQPLHGTGFDLLNSYSDLQHHMIDSFSTSTPTPLFNGINAVLNDFVLPEISDTQIYIGEVGDIVNGENASHDDWLDEIADLVISKFTAAYPKLGTFLDEADSFITDPAGWIDEQFEGVFSFFHDFINHPETWFDTYVETPFKTKFAKYAQYAFINLTKIFASLGGGFGG